jgi:hypothetical protein
LPPKALPDRRAIDRDRRNVATIIASPLGEHHARSATPHGSTSARGWTRGEQQNER